MNLKIFKSNLKKPGISYLILENLINLIKYCYKHKTFSVLASHVLLYANEKNQYEASHTLDLELNTNFRVI